MPDASVRPARPSDRAELARLRAALWPDYTVEQHANEVGRLFAGTLSLMPLACFVAEAADRGLVGFVEVGLRSHANGCDLSRPVGFIEGWYVVPARRRQGIGRRLVAAAEDWSRGRGCAEMASDSVLENDAARRAHEGVGYEVVERCVNYRKAL